MTTPLSITPGKLVSKSVGESVGESVALLEGALRARNGKINISLTVHALEGPILGWLVGKEVRVV